MSESQTQAIEGSQNGESERTDSQIEPSEGPSLKKTQELKIEKDLKGILRENGLDTEIWGERFLMKGIQNCLQLKHADADTLIDLQAESQYGWEKNALEACIKSTNDEKKDEKKEQLTQTIGNVQKMMQELTDNVDEKGRRDRIAIRFHDAMNHKELHKDLTKWNISGSELVKRENLTSLNVVMQISAGQILRGMHIQENMRNCVKPKRRLISIHQKDVDLMFPPISEKYTSMEFFEQNQSQAFDHVIEHWGLSAAVGTGKGFGIFSINVGFKNDETHESTHKTNTLTAFTEIKDLVHVTTASFSLDDVKHSISDEAIDELKKLEKRKDNYFLFFEEFGSHYYTGTYNFGGILTKSVKCHSKENISETDNLKLVKKEQQCSVSGMFSGFSFGVTGSHEHAKDTDSGQYKKEEDYKVEKELTMKGGPPEVDQISLWKLGLVESNRTWAIIDQDNFETKWRSVWDLLTDDLKGQFENIERVRRGLERDFYEYAAKIREEQAIRRDKLKRAMERKKIEQAKPFAMGQYEAKDIPFYFSTVIPT